MRGSLDWRRRSSEEMVRSLLFLGNDGSDRADAISLDELLKVRAQACTAIFKRFNAVRRGLSCSI